MTDITINQTKKLCVEASVEFAGSTSFKAEIGFLKIKAIDHDGRDCVIRITGFGTEFNDAVKVIRAAFAQQEVAV